MALRCTYCARCGVAAREARRQAGGSPLVELSSTVPVNSTSTFTGQGRCALVSGVVGVLLAAGAGSRFGSGGVPKVLRPFRGRPLLTWPLAALRDGGVDRVVVVLGARADEVVAGAGLGDATVVRCAEWSESLSTSLRTGVRAAAKGGADAVVIALADQPLLDARAIARVIAARAPSQFNAIRATYAGVPGHPTLLESGTFGAVEDLRGDTGARALLSEPVTHVGLVACDGLGRPDDVDTPAALARLEALA
jgi:CTP:molybdopterin cytidylyltransferase MocA